jgi:Transcriptional regulator, AbiEi antitoxin, Type IV TA system
MVLLAQGFGEAPKVFANRWTRSELDRLCADRHQHAWLKRLDKDAIDLGEGKRMLVKGGKLNKPYQITGGTRSRTFSRISSS